MKKSRPDKIKVRFEQVKTNQNEIDTRVSRAFALLFEEVWLQMKKERENHLTQEGA